MFSYVVSRLGLLHDPPPEAGLPHLALHLTRIHAIFRGPPPPHAGPLGGQHARLVQRYAECVFRRGYRYRVCLEECEPRRLASRVFQCLEEGYSAALTHLNDAHVALRVMQAGRDLLLPTPTPINNNNNHNHHHHYLHHVVTHAVDFLATSFKLIPPGTTQPTPPAPPQAKEPLMAAIGPFFPAEFFKVMGAKVLARGAAPPVLVQEYLGLASVLVRVFEPPAAQQVVPHAHVDALVALCQGQDDCGLLEYLEVVLGRLQKGTQPGALQRLCVTLCGAAVTGVRAAWAHTDVPCEALHEEQPVLRVTPYVHQVVLVSRLNTSLFPEEAVQEACEQVLDAFVRHLQRVAARHQDAHLRYFILLKNLLVLGPYEQAKQYLDLPTHIHAHADP